MDPWDRRFQTYARAATQGGFRFIRTVIEIVDLSDMLLYTRKLARLVDEETQLANSSTCRIFEQFHDSSQANRESESNANAN